MVGLGAKKQVLVVGNDGVQLYVLRGKTVSLYQDFSHAGGSLTSDLRAAFKAINLPLILLFDVAEQQYRRETIPKVGFMDKGKVIKRKLVMAFPQQLFRAFYVYKEKERSSNEGAVALFAGLSATLTITQVMDSILGSEVYIEGAALLPLESISLVVKLAAETQKRNKTSSRARWTILMTQDKTGGLRQIVVKDGELALTRMTPLVVDFDQPDALGDEMVREFNATLTYLSRFGYVPSDGLDLYVVSPENVTQRLRNYKLPVSELHTLTLLEACNLAGLKAAQGRDMADYGEILHAGWVAMQRGLLMSLSSPVLDKVKQARQSARIMIFAILIGILYVGWQMTSVQSAISNLSADVKSQEAQKRSLQNDFETLTKSLTPLKYDADKTKLILDAYDNNSKQAMDIKPTLNAIALLLDHDKVILKDLAITAPDTGGVAAGQPVLPVPGAPPTDAKKSVKIVMEFDFPKNIPIEQSARDTLELADNMRKRFPGRTVVVNEIVGDLALDKTVQGKSEIVLKNTALGNDVKNNSSKITLQGALE